MIKYFYCIGDIHGIVQPIVDWAARVHDAVGSLNEYGLIIMGDAGFNYYLNKRDTSAKKKANNLWGLTIYCVRGNHEQRPELVPGMKFDYDENVCNSVFYEDDFMNIRYLMDGYAYNFNGLRTLILGGAYSIDKEYRLSRGYPYQWFENEQLSAREMQEIEELYTDEDTRPFDVVMSHTCPFSWQPTDLFLSFVESDSVDNSMEVWMDSFKDKIQWKLWLFGHFHADRYIHMDVRIRMLYQDIEPLDSLYRRATNA